MTLALPISQPVSHCWGGLELKLIWSESSAILIPLQIIILVFKREHGCGSALCTCQHSISRGILWGLHGLDWCQGLVTKHTRKSVFTRLISCCS